MGWSEVKIKMEVQDLKKKLCKGVIPSEESEMKKVEKVLAPFMRTLKKRKHRKADVLPSVYEDVYMKQNPKERLLMLQEAFVDPLELKTLLNETAELLKAVTKSKSVNLYLTDYVKGEILLCPKYVEINPRFERRYKIETGTYVAAHVAFTKEYVVSRDVLGDVRFPQGIPEVPVVKSVLCLPVITNAENDCIGVIELYRECSDKPYDMINVQICNALTAWLGIAVEENKAKLRLAKEIELQRQFSQLAGYYFSGKVPFDRIVSDFLKIAKAVVYAEKGAFYVFHEPVPLNSQEVLMADAYVEGIDENDETVLYRKRAQVKYFIRRFVKNQPGVPGYAARTGEMINIHDAYKDPRFDKKSDSADFRTRSILAFPVKSENGVVAVLKLINSLNSPYFRAEDVQLIAPTLCYINFICGYFLLSKAFNQMEERLTVKDTLLEFHTKPSPEDLNILKVFIQGEPHVPNAFFQFKSDLLNFEEDTLKYVAYVFLGSNILEPCFEVQNLLDFLLRIKKSYRPVFYHNFEHSFYVFHFVFNVIYRNKTVYPAAEIVTMLLASLCHDVDHSGLTNAFLCLTNDPLYRLYGDYCGETHRYEFVFFLMQETDLLSNVSTQTYHLIRKNLKTLMLGFNLAVHFENRQAITRILNADSFDWDDPDHRLLSQNIVLLCGDNCFNFKSFDVVKKFTVMFYKELYKQGDLEKSMGFFPLSMLDRNKIDVYPENQIIFLSVVLVPALEILIKLFPNLNALDDLLANTLDKWNELLQSRGQEMWRINQAMVKEKKVTHKVTLSSTISSIRTIVSQDMKALRI